MIVYDIVNNMDMDGSDMDPIEIYPIIPKTADLISCTRIEAWKRGCHKLFLINSKFMHAK